MNLSNMLPNQLSNRQQINRRLRIKSSISNPRALISGLILLWIGNNRPDTFVYADSSSDGKNKLSIDNDILQKTITFWKNTGDLPENFKDLLEGSLLFNSQLEPLQVAFELVWKLCSISFLDENLPSSAERTGGIRRLKVIKFTTMMDFINEVLTDSSEITYKPEVLKLLINWLHGKSGEGIYEQKLSRALLYLSEDTHFAIKKEDDHLLEFQQEGIYQVLLESNDVSLGSSEKMGPLRILSSIIESNLHPHLKLQDNKIYRNENIELRTYQNRVTNYLDIIERVQYINIENYTYSSEENSSGIKSQVNDRGTDEFPYNWIIYGAPGTGKSHFLDIQSEQLNPKEIVRVTFYSDYTYGQFVGGYRPAPLYDPKETTAFLGRNSTPENRPGKPIIEYRFVPGPFLSILEKAVKNPSEKYLLIIEELNRADAAAVFGDIFQLLDRKNNGESKYPVNMVSDATDYLLANKLDVSIKLPSNLYIWATLNNADQGVVPLDTAFKRRWSFTYMDLDKNEIELDEIKIKTKFKTASGVNLELNWNKLRRKINENLSHLNIHEDMHIGPFFLSMNELNDDSAFKYKLLSYIRDDVLRHRADEFFSSPGSTLSALLEDYDNGKNIFKFDLE